LIQYTSGPLWPSAADLMGRLQDLAYGRYIGALLGSCAVIAEAYKHEWPVALNGHVDGLFEAYEQEWPTLPATGPVPRILGAAERIRAYHEEAWDEGRQAVYLAAVAESLTGLEVGRDPDVQERVSLPTLFEVLLEEDSSERRTSLEARFRHEYLVWSAAPPSTVSPRLRPRP
jgi:hypothetical protein